MRRLATLDLPDAPVAVAALVERSKQRLQETPGGSRVSALVGREVDLAWTMTSLGEQDVPGIVLWGRSGVGRTRLLQEVATRAARRGFHVVHAPASPSPYDEIGFHGVRRLVTNLLGASPEQGALSSGEAAPAGPAATPLLQRDR